MISITHEAREFVYNTFVTKSINIMNLMKTVKIFTHFILWIFIFKDVFINVIICGDIVNLVVIFNVNFVRNEPQATDALFRKFCIKDFKLIFRNYCML